MPVYYARGNRLVRASELATGGAAKIGDISSRSFAPATLERPGVVAKPFAPIGPGLPLTIWIASMYPGDLPPRAFGGGRGVLVSSAVKSWQAFDAMPRALNVLQPAAQRRSLIATPAAVQQGTVLVFYTPALVDRSLTVTLEMAFDHVDEPFFQQVGNFFAAAAGLPLFASASPYLLAAGALFKVGGRLGNALFDRRAEFQGTEQIHVDLAGQPATQAGYALVTRTELDDQTLRSFSLSSGGQLVGTAGQLYDGALPHMVIALDGTKDERLDGFRATAASAALLERFYNIRENGETNADALVEALKFYNDFRYRKELDAVRAKLGDASLTMADKERLEKQRDALSANIQTEYFKK